MSTNGINTISESVYQYKIGTRVIRNLPFDDYNEQLDDSSIPNTTKLDSITFSEIFANIVGTVTKLRSNGQVNIFWDDGTKGEYRSGESNDLRIVDNSTAGVSYEYLRCSECYWAVAGILWTCVDCKNYRMCSSCYHGDKHDLEHRFARTVNPHSTSELVEPRSGSNKIVLQGIFENSEVVRIDGFSNEQPEDSIFPTGIVLYSSLDSRAYIKWTDGKKESYLLGDSGIIFLNAIRPSNGPYVYHEHLPLFNETEFEKLRRRMPEYDEKKPFVYALHHAVLCGNLKMIELLKNNDVDLDACDSLNQTPLYIAVCLGHKHVVAKLIEWGCDPQKYNILQDSCLLFAIRNKENEIFELLFHSKLRKDTFEKIIISSIRNYNSFSLNIILDKFPKKKSLSSIFTEVLFYKKVNLLQFAVLRDNHEACERLIQSGKIDLNVFSSAYKKTALHMASEGEYMNIFKLLISSNCDVNIADKDGDTALHYIIRKRERLARELSFNTEEKVKKNKMLEEMAIMLVSNGAKLEQSNNEQLTPMHLIENVSFVTKLVLASQEYIHEQNLQDLNQTKQRLQDFEEKLTCPVCIDRHKNIIFQCGHGFCAHCAEPLNVCPVCRRRIQQKINMF